MVIMVVWKLQIFQVGVGSKSPPSSRPGLDRVKSSKVAMIFSAILLKSP